MEPLHPTVRKQLLTRLPPANPLDIDEYERLLADRFAEDPSAAPAAAPVAGAAAGADPREARLAQLHQKLFGGGPAATP